MLDDVGGVANHARAFTELVESHAAQRQSEEAAEGFASFLEKRPARWNRAHKPKV